MNSTDVGQQRQRTVTAHEADLGQRWAEAYDCWVDAPGTKGRLYAVHKLANKTRAPMNGPWLYDN